MTDTQPPRCPSCGEPLTISVYTKQADGSYLLVKTIENATGYCLNCKKYNPAPPEPRPVPCPSCGGDGDMYVETYSDGDVRATCTLCRGSGDVPPDLAAAWVAAGQRSGGGEG